MLKGRYRDVVADPAGRRVLETPWRSNLLVDGAFTLLAALLGRDPEMAGILYWAVGSGRDSWDENRPQPSSWTTDLAAEVRRVEVPTDAIGYVDERGAPVDGPTPNLEVRLVFEWPDGPVTLREFGIYGGDAGEQPGTGVMLNHVIHERIDLQPAQRLTRELRLAFGRGAGRHTLDAPPPWLADAAPRVLEGVGPGIAGALTRKGVTTVEALANADPLADRVARVPVPELRSKARLALQTAVGLNPPPGLHRLTVSKVLSTAPAELARQTGVVASEVAFLQEQLFTLGLALDDRFLGRMTVESLVRTDRSPS